MHNPQPDLFTFAAPSRPKTVLEIASAHSDIFPTEFLDWLPENLHIWEAFVDQALKIIARGYKHYSSYTIVEFIRHHSALEESGGEWKINNNVRPYLPRLFDLIHPQHAGLWEYRLTTKPAQKGH